MRIATFSLLANIAIFCAFSCALEKVEDGNPTITTAPVTGITTTSATTGGNVTNDGGNPVTERGVCWGTTQSPTILNSKTSDGTGTGNFSSSITGLSPNTTYYVRAYATNVSGTFYGNEANFTTLAAPPEPVASFTLPTGLVYENCPVKFTNTSTDATTYKWSFGDGEASTLANPEHTFTLPFTYNVRLIASNATKSDTITLPVTVYPVTIFAKTYTPGTSDHDVRSVLSLENDGYVTVGIKKDLNATGWSAYIFKTDNNGTKTWEQTFGSTTNNIGRFVTQLSDGNLLASGEVFTSGTTYDFVLAKFTKSGVKLWERSVGNTSGDAVFGGYVVELSNGNFIVAGQTSGGIVIGCDPNGNKIWQNILGNAGDLSSIVRTSDNKLLVCGSTGGSGSSLYLAKLEPTDGSIIWEQTFGNNAYNGRVLALKDGNYLLAGGSNSSGTVQAYLVKIDPSGNKLWDKYIGQGVSCTAVAEAMDGGFVITGQSSTDAVYLAKVDASGILQWEKNLGGKIGWDIKQTADCGFIICGTIGIGTPTSGIYLVKTDKDGNYQ